MKVGVKDFISKREAAILIGVHPDNEYFSEIWKRVAGTAYVVHSQTNEHGKPAFVNSHGSSFEVTRENTIPIGNGLFKEYAGGDTEDNVKIDRSTIEDLERLYFSYAPYTSLMPNAAEEAPKAKIVKTEGNGQKPRLNLLVTIPEKTDDHFDVPKIAKLLGVAESSISERLRVVKSQWEKYWLKENMFQGGLREVSPAKLLTGISGGKGELKAEQAEYSIRVGDDFGLMRYSTEGSKNNRVFCLHKNKIAEVFPDLYKVAVLKKIGTNIEEGEHVNTPRVFRERYLENVGRFSWPQIVSQIKKQYDEMLYKKVDPSEEGRLLWVEEMAFPASAFCYGKINGKVGFCIKTEAKSWFEKLPEMKVRHPQTTNSWFNAPRVASFFNHRLEKVDDLAKINRSNPKVMEFFHNAANEKLGWVLEAKSSFLASGRDDSERVLEISNKQRVPVSKVAVTKINGGAGESTAFFEHSAMLEVFDCIGFLPQRIRNKAVDKSCYAGPSTKEYWLSFAQRLQEKTQPEHRILVGNLCVIELANMRGEEEHRFAQKNPVNLSMKNKTHILRQITQKAKELYGYDIDLDKKLVRQPTQEVVSER